MSDLSRIVRDIIGAFSKKPKAPPAPPPEPVPTDLAGKIVYAMKKHNYKLFTGPGECNIVFVEGMGPDGEKNDNTPNRFNDGRFVLTLDADKWKILGAWEATTEPGKYWTENRMNEKGAAHVKPGQYKAWQVGMHHSHEAWVQTGGPVTVCRDDNEDNVRDGDEEDTGDFGINMHGGYDLPKSDLGRSSAGCLVGRSMEGHRKFMSITKADPRVQANRRFVMTATLLLASDIP